MLSIGLSTWKSNPSVYYTENEIFSRFIAIHVYDILWSGSKNLKHKIIVKLQNCFIIGKENSMTFRYLGLNLSENCIKNIFLDQNYYISQLVKVWNIDNSTSIPDKMRLIVETLLWISTQIRPDISLRYKQIK